MPGCLTAEILKDPQKTRNRVTLGHFKMLHLGSPKNPQKRQPLTLMLHLGAFLPSGGKPRGLAPVCPP